MKMNNESFNGYLKLDADINTISSYTSLCILVAGLAGNSLTLTVMTSRHCKKSSFTVYLACLAAVDSVVLLVWPLRYWLIDTFGIDINIYPGTCKLINLLTYLGQHTSSWLVVSLTAERVYCTYFPLKSRNARQPRTGFVVFGTILVVLFMFDSHILYGFTLKSHENQTLCDLMDGWYATFFSIYFSWMEIAILFLLPAMLIVSGNVATVIKLFSSRLALNANVHVSGSAMARNHYVLTVTMMISTAFIALVGPMAVFFVIRPYVFPNKQLNHYYPSSRKEMIVDVVTSILAYINHSSNFYLYVLSGRRFRQDLKRQFSGSRSSSSN